MQKDTAEKRSFSGHGYK